MHFTLYSQLCLWVFRVLFFVCYTDRETNDEYQLHIRNIWVFSSSANETIYIEASKINVQTHEQKISDESIDNSLHSFQLSNSCDAVENKWKWWWEQKNTNYNNNNKIKQ